jgi:hypothetical protein
METVVYTGFIITTDGISTNFDVLICSRSRFMPKKEVELEIARKLRDAHSAPWSARVDLKEVLFESLQEAYESYQGENMNPIALYAGFAIVGNNIAMISCKEYKSVPKEIIIERTIKELQQQNPSQNVQVQLEEIPFVTIQEAYLSYINGE